MPKKKTTIQLQFDPCFDQAKLAELAPHLPATYGVMNRLAPWRKGRWPSRVRCMTSKKIVDGRKRGAGHGYVYPPSDARAIWMNPHMTPQGLLLVLIHENCHVAWPDATESEINCVLVPQIYCEIFGVELDPAWARSQGLGSPVPGVGDRSFCR